MWALTYIKNIINYELIYKADLNDPDGDIYAYSDSNFAGDIDTGRSTGGFMIFKGKACIGWQLKLQTHVTLSTTEAEYVALSTTAKELI